MPRSMPKNQPPALRRLEQVNQMLKAGGRKVALVTRGTRLYRQATLPAKKGLGARKQCRLRTGLVLSDEGVMTAEALALELWRDLSMGCFSWAKWQDYPAWQNGGGHKQGVLLATAISDFRKNREAEWRDEGRSEEWMDAVWTDRFWSACFKWLDGLMLDDEALMAAVSHFQQNTRGRKVCVQLLKRLVKETDARYPGQVDVTLPWNKLRGRYAASQAKVRVPVNDQAIIDAVDSIRNPGWKAVYMLMALFGMRNHECWYCTVQPAGRIWIAKIATGTKTGSRNAFPIVCRDPELSVFNFDRLDPWFDFVQRAELPVLKTAHNKALGGYTSKAFKRYGIPFTPYGLRHAAVKRGKDLLGINSSLLSRSMGNSEKMIDTIYRQQATDDEIAEMFLKHL